MQRTGQPRCQASVIPLRICTIVCLTGLLSLTREGFAQQKLPDNPEARGALDSAIAVYMSDMGQALPVFQGAEWVSKAQKAKGHPFFRASTPYRGIVRYKGLDYPGLDLQFDLQSACLLVLPGNGQKLEIPRHKVDRFVLDTTAFFRPGPEARSLGLSDTVFYRVVYDGPTRVLAWHRKYLTDRPGEEFSELFVETTGYYLWNGTVYREIRSEKQLLSLRGNRNRALKKKLSAAHISFKKDTEQALVTGAAWYDQPE